MSTNCSTEFIGELCETYAPDPCNKINCANGARCENGKCLCPAGFVGLFCDELASTTQEHSIKQPSRTEEIPGAIAWLTTTKVLCECICVHVSVKNDYDVIISRRIPPHRGQLAKKTNIQSY